MFKNVIKSLTSISYLKTRGYRILYADVYSCPSVDLTVAKLK